MIREWNAVYWQFDHRATGSIPWHERNLQNLHNEHAGAARDGLE